MKFVRITDPAQPTKEPWWVVRVSKGDNATIAILHKWLSTALLIKDGKDPHMQCAREKGEFIAALREPSVLSTQFLITALRLSSSSDIYVNKSGGMCPCGLLYSEMDHVDAADWPKNLDKKLKLIVSTWGKHYYITAAPESLTNITFLTKYNTEQQAMETALRFALPTNIWVRRETSYVSGD